MLDSQPYRTGARFGFCMGRFRRYIALGAYMSARYIKPPPLYKRENDAPTPLLKTSPEYITDGKRCI